MDGTLLIHQEREKERKGTSAAGVECEYVDEYVDEKIKQKSLMWRQETYTARHEAPGTYSVYRIS